MILGKVVGSVVSTQKVDGARDIKLLMVEKVQPQGLSDAKVDRKNVVVAMDAIGAGPGEAVLLVAGSSARMTEATNGRPVDLTVVAIVDELEEHGKIIWSKYPEQEK